MLCAQKAGKKAVNDKTPGREHDRKPAWLAITVAEYTHGREDSTGDEIEEQESGADESESSEDDVQVSALSIMVDIQIIVVCIA